jgi:predicted DCC family thiol-disulfide oxidoreductase YuxK
MGAMPDGRLTVLYDGECRLCASSKARLERWKSADRLRFVPIQSPEARLLAPDVPEAELRGAMHVLEDGRVWSGADGWFRLMRLAPLRLRWIGWVTPRWIARPVYRWVARNRYQWFGKVGCAEGACAVPPADRQA